MTSDLSPEGSPFKPIDEKTWALELIQAAEQGNLDEVRRVVSEDEEADFLSAKRDFEDLSDNDLNLVLFELFQDEDTLDNLQQWLADAKSKEEQLEIVSTFDTKQKAGLVVQATRVIAWREF